LILNHHLDPTVSMLQDLPKFVQNLLFIRRYGHDLRLFPRNTPHFAE